MKLLKKMFLVCTCIVSVAAGGASNLFKCTQHGDIEVENATNDIPTASYKVMEQYMNPSRGSKKYSYSFTFFEKLGNAADDTNVASQFGNKLCLDNVPVCDIEGSSVSFARGENKLLLELPNSYVNALENDVILEFKGKPHFQNYLIQDMCFTLKASDQQMYFNQVLLGKEWPNGQVYDIFPEDNPPHIYADHQQDTLPKNGILIKFSNYLCNNLQKYEGLLKHDNLADKEIGNHIYSNGIKFKDIEKAEIYYHSVNFLWVWVPDMERPIEGKNYAEVSIDSGTTLFDSILPEVHFYHVRDYADKSGWELDKPDDQQGEPVPLLEVGPWFDYHNNGIFDGYGCTVLSFGEGYDPCINLGKDGIPNTTNYATKYFPIGYKCTFNGLPVAYYNERIVINYEAGANYLTFKIPVELLTPSNGYKVPTIHFENATNFADSCIEEITLYLFNGKWQLVKPEIIEDSKLSTFVSLEDCFGEPSFTLNNEIQTVSGNLPSAESTTFTGDFKLLEDKGSFAANIFSSDNLSGLRVSVNSEEKSISLENATNGKTLVVAKCATLTSNEWFNLAVETNIHNNKIDVNLAIDGVIYASCVNQEIGDISRFGSNMAFHKGVGNLSFRNAKIGEDIKRPYLTYGGKETYVYEANSLAPDYSLNFKAYDSVDGDVTNSIEYVWPTGAITEQGKLNRGNWNLCVKFSDSSGNEVMKCINVIVSDKTVAEVSFDGKNTQTVDVGTKLTKPADPSKESDNECNYTFDCWTYNGNPWNFDYDYVTEDMNLVPTFIKSYKNYVVIIKSEGVSRENMQLDFHYGAILSTSIFNIEGYSLEAYVNGNKVTNIEVKSDMVVTLKYTKDQPSSSSSSSSVIPSSDPSSSSSSSGQSSSSGGDPTGKGCGGGCSGSIAIGVPLFIGIVITITLCFSMKKKEDK